MISLGVQFALRGFAALAWCLLAGSVEAQGPLNGQSYLRAWGASGFSTEAREGRIVQIEADYLSTSVLRSDGRLFVNGQNAGGMLDVPLLPPGLRYTQVGLGTALVSDGSVTVWGVNAIAGTRPPLFPPAPGLPAGMRYTQVSAAPGGHVLALRSDGTIIAWGLNYFGQCNVPPLPPGVAVVRVRAQYETSYAVLSNGTLLVWGRNDLSQFAVPPLPPGVGYVDLCQSLTHVVALRTDGQIVAWGVHTMQYGQLNVPPLPPGMTYVAASAGWAFSAALRSDGAVLCWGLNHVGQCNPPPIPPGLFVETLDCGFSFVVALLSNGEILDWGDTSLDGFVPRLPSPGLQHGACWTDVGRGYEHTVAIASAGQVLAWGNNYAGQCNVPAAVQGSAVKVKAGVYHSGALLQNGQLVCWGDNTVGQCSPPPLPSGVRYIDFAIGSGHTVAVRSDGNAVAFGQNAFGCCVIAGPPPGVGYVKADAEYAITVLLRSDGQIVSFGSNVPSTYHLVPPLPPGITYVQTGCARPYNAALRSDGTFVRWGSIPTGGVDVIPEPVLPWGVYCVDIDSGVAHTTIRRSDGQVQSFGLCARLQDLVPPLDPGTSYVQISSNGTTVAARVGPTSTYVGVAHGCAGTMPSARLVPRDTPRIGATLEVTAFDLPVHIAMLAMGMQQLPTAIPLASMGMPGCTWHVPLDAVALLVGQNNQARFQLPIPASLGLVGMHFFHQALVLDPTANGFGAVVSDAAEGVIGRP